MNCVICGMGMHMAFRAMILQKFDVAYYQCYSCGLLQTEAPYWLDEAYNSPIIDADTGLAMRNFSITTRLSALLYCSFDARGTYVDVAGGYGLLVRLMRDFGFNFFWDDKYCQNLLARGFESTNINSPVAAVTAFEVFEHLPDPINFVKNTLQRFGTKTLIFSTQLYSGNTPPPPDWWYYARSGGQHITFFQTKTLQQIANILGLRFYTMHGLHIFTEQPLKRTALAHLLTSRLSAPAALYIRQRLGSKTMTDHLNHAEKEHHENRI